MRRSYGFRTFRCLELALYHSLGVTVFPPHTTRVPVFSERDEA